MAVGEREGLGTTQEVFDFFYNDIPAGDPFWDVVIGDPGIPFLFNDAVYVRGAMTLQALRNEVGDQDFFRILRAWAAKRASGNGTTGQAHLCRGDGHERPCSQDRDRR